MEELRFKPEEMRKAFLDIYPLPPETDIYETFKNYFSALPYWKYTFKGFKDKGEIRNKFIRYIIYFYSPNLKCIKAKYPEQIARKMACATLAGFEVDEDGNLHKKVQDIIKGKNPATNQMIISFCRSLGSDAYTTIAHLRDLYYRSLEKEGGDQLDGLELGRLIDSLKKINALEKEFLQDDESPQLNRSLIQRIEAEKLEYTPEEIAEKLDNGLNPIQFNPYDTVEKD